MAVGDQVAAGLAARMRADALVGGLPITVTVDSGIAVMTGMVDCLLARQHAVRLVRATPELRAVIDRLEVVAAPRAADELRRDVVHALASAPLTRNTLFHVSVAGGAIVLDGVVETDEARRAAEQAAAGTRGVAVLASRVLVIPGGRRARPGAHWRADVAAVRQSPAWLGQVPPDPSRSVVCERTMAAAFARDQRIPPWPQPEVYVQSGRAVLLGSVPTLLAARAAAEDAANTVCVRSVDNQLVVEPPAPVNDEEVEDAAAATLSADRYLRDAAIAVRVTEGEVVLTGTVAAAFQIDRAARAAASVPGAVSVTPRLLLTARAQ